LPYDYDLKAYPVEASIILDDNSSYPELTIAPATDIRSHVFIMIFVESTVLELVDIGFNGTVL